MTAEGDRVAGCAALRLAYEEPVFATAPEVATAWLLVEHPGPWPATGPPAGLAGEVLRVWEAAGHAGVRRQWIRPTRRRRSSPVTVFTAGTRLGATWLERRVVDDLRDLAALDVATLGQGRPPGFGARTGERVVLVCTHGRRDVCCARFGRPVADRLDHALPGLVWEATHVGGHRFAANVVTFPDGVYHGGISPGDAGSLAEALLAGRVVADRLRGRAGLPAPVQAADYYARIRHGVYEVDGVSPLRHNPVGTDGTVRVELLLGAGTRCAVYVRPRKLMEGRATPCGGADPAGARTTFDLVAFEQDKDTAA
ncbi:sucrase ferredoxin [Saccharomonospora sp. NPDC046836]|uniref:sucrase ferredoxin n=1 Tax=Saccharomonospora sp. NPDC046836 TaxID=3156921 RepID=UPI0033DDF87E